MLLSSVFTTALFRPLELEADDLMVGTKLADLLSIMIKRQDDIFEINIDNMTEYNDTESYLPEGHYCNGTSISVKNSLMVFRYQK